MKHALVVVALASTFTFFTKPADPQKLPSPSGALGVEVQCEPSARSEIQLLRRPSPSSYNCSAYVFDANDTSRGVAGTQVVVDAGERQTKSSTNDDTEIKFTVAISKGHDRAATDVVVTKAGKTVLRQKSNVILLANTRD
jgi:hypothetical protein